MSGSQNQEIERRTMSRNSDERGAAGRAVRQRQQYRTNHDRLDVTMGARLTYEELIEGPSSVAAEEELPPIIIRGVRDPSNVMVLPPSDGSLSIDEIPPITLMRQQGARQAYAQTERAPINLNHHDPEWGRIYFAVVYPRVIISSGGGGGSRGPASWSLSEGQQQQQRVTFQAPPESKAQYVAIKQLNKAAVHRYLHERGGNEDPYKEIARMQELGDNIHVLKCIEALEDDEYLYIVTPKACSEGTLKDAIPWFSPDTMEPRRVKHIFRQILEILVYLERHGICHRDLSPDNFLFLTPGRLVVFDLALSLRVPRNVVNESTGESQRSLMCPQGNFGTHAYMCPEVFMNREYDSLGSDLWSVTVILYNMLTSQFLYSMPLPTDLCFRYFILARGLSSEPLNELTMEILMSLIPPGAGIHASQQQQYNDLLNRAIAHLNLDTSAVELLEHVLKVNPYERWTLSQVIESDFMNEDEG